MLLQSFQIEAEQSPRCRLADGGDLHLAAANISGHSFRIGGATDLADQGASPLLLQAKGRWASDIGRIYARMTRRAQLQASSLMQKKGHRAMEDIFPSFTQAA